MDAQKVKQFLSQYVTYLQVEKGLAEGTQRLYQNAVETFINFCRVHQESLYLEETWEIDDIGVRELEFFIQEHMVEKGWKLSTLVSQVSGIRSFFNFLFIKNFIPKNPIQHFHLEREINEVILSKITEDQVQALFAQPIPNTTEAIRNRLMLECCYSFGLSPNRVSQIVQILKSPEFPQVQILYDNEVIEEYPLGGATEEILSKYKSLLPAEIPEGFWFDKRGQRLSKSQVLLLLKKEMQRFSDLAEERPGILRQISVQHFAESGADVRSLKELKKVKQLQTLEPYTKEPKKSGGMESLKDKFRLSHLRESDQTKSLSTED